MYINKLQKHLFQCSLVQITYFIPMNNCFKHFWDECLLEHILERTIFIVEYEK